MDKIRIALLGSVSVGKSTLINALFVKQFSKTKIKRTTMVPYIFRECKNSVSQDEILNMEKKINDTNIEIIKMTEDSNFSLTMDTCIPLSFDVPKIFDLLTSKNAANIELEIYDIPGLNDNRTQNVYFDWVKKNFYLFDIVIFITSIDKALNETDELNILKFIMENISYHKDKYRREIAFIPIVNKCDNMYCEDNELKFSNSDEEYNDLFLQITHTIETQSKNYNVYTSPLIPISSEDAFIYRTFYTEHPQDYANIDNKYYHKLGINEYGKTKWNIYSKTNFDNYKKILLESMHNKNTFIDNIKNTGYYKFRNILNFVIEENIYKFLIERINYNIIDVIQFDKNNIQKYLDEMISYYEKEKRINRLYDKYSNNVLMAMETTIVKYLDENIQINIDDIYTEHQDFLTNNLNRFNQYITFINAIKAILQKENFSFLQDQLHQYLIEVAKKIVELYLMYINRQSLNCQNIDPIYNVLILLNDNLDISFNLDIGKKMTIEQLNMLPLLRKNISEILTNLSLLMKENKEIDNLLVLFQFITENQLYEDKNLLRKSIMHLVVNELNKIQFSAQLTVNKKNIIYLNSSKRLLYQYVDKVEIIPYYYLIDITLKKLMVKQFSQHRQHVIDEWFMDSDSENINLDMEKLYISLIDN